VLWAFLFSGPVSRNHCAQIIGEWNTGEAGPASILRDNEILWMCEALKSTLPWFSQHGGVNRIHRLLGYALAKSPLSVRNLLSASYQVKDVSIDEFLKKHDLPDEPVQTPGRILTASPERSHQPSLGRAFARNLNRSGFQDKRVEYISVYGPVPEFHDWIHSLESDICQVDGCVILLPFCCHAVRKYLNVNVQDLQLRYEFSWFAPTGSNEGSSGPSFPRQFEVLAFPMVSELRLSLFGYSSFLELVIKGRNNLGMSHSAE
jgi:hypothetical protein